MKASSYTLIAAFSAILALTACGGGGESATTPPPSTSQPTALTKTDTVVGTGTTAAVGSTITVHYSGYLYNSNATDFKGTKFDGTTVAGGPATFALASGSLIEGWVQGVPGMKVGGKRTIVFPASLGYGAQGQGSIPGNSGLVFDIELVAVK